MLDIIVNEARERSIPRDDFLRFAYIETGGVFNERASRGPNGAKGLFQFVPSTAARYSIAGREFDPVANTDAAARLYLDNRRDLMVAQSRTGHAYLSGNAAPDGMDMYLAHQQGAAGYRSIQAATAKGSFTRTDTRPHILNNVARRDIEAVTGVSFDRFSRMFDQDMAKTFVRYWDTKYDRIRISEMGIEPFRNGIPTSSEPAEPSHAPRHRPLVTLKRAFELGIEHDDVRYRLGSKSAGTGQIDCSGWVVLLQNATMNEINAKVGRTIFGRGELFNPGMDAAATIVQKSTQRSGALLEGAQVTHAALREGMVIGEDHGRTSFDAGRYRGIDHIVMVVRDPHSGQLRVSQSRSGEGVETIPLDRYLQAQKTHGVMLYASDPLHKARALIAGQPPVVSSATHSTATTLPWQNSPAADADHLLRFGEKGPAVERLQQRLADLGYRGADDRALRADGDFGSNTKFALQAFQREHGLQGLGVAGKWTERALGRAERALMSHTTHPQHALYAQVLDKVQAEERTRGQPTGHHSRRIAAALAVECLREGITRVDRVELNRDVSLVRGVQVSPIRDEPGLNRSTDGISVRQAVAQPLRESSEQMHHVAVNRQAQREARQQEALRNPVRAALSH
ncbi:MAG: peptidoglycan-binding protein [Lysobacter sp.]|nr:MAG: peptidoglycan-binding protein [Lysobacter sp.]